MTISYQGDNYFKIQSGDDAILIDPTNARSFKGATAVVLTTLPTSPMQLENGLVVDHQGEYETKGIRIEGWSVGQGNGVDPVRGRPTEEHACLPAGRATAARPVREKSSQATGVVRPGQTEFSNGPEGRPASNGVEKTVYRIRWDEIVIGVLGHLTKDPDPKILLALNGCDIVIAPAGGSPYLAPSSAAKLVRQIEPSIVIPALFKDPKAFLKEFGGDGTKTEEKLTVKKKDLAPHAMKVVLLAS